MDEDRKIRFLVAPVLFVTSLAWLVASDPCRGISDLIPGISVNLDKLSNVIAVLTGGGIVVFTLGFVIGTISYVVLRFGFYVKARICGGASSHEVSLDKATLDLMWSRVNASGKPDPSKAVFAGVTFDHDMLRSKHEGVHLWLIRRWSAFSIAVTSTTGLLLSLGLGALTNFAYTAKWWVPVFMASVFFIISAVLAWRDTMGMLRFQAGRQMPAEKEGD